jgi:hypothetical protein
MSRYLRHICLKAAGISSLLILGATADSQSVEAKVKAAFLYNFVKYVEWPVSVFDGASSPVVIGVVGSDTLSGALESVVEGKTAGGRRLIVRHLTWSDDLSACQELFVPAGEMGGASHLKALRGKPVLVVGEYPGFARNHGAINFTVEGNRVRFEINESSANQSGLSISSKLLSLGRTPS